MNKEAQDKLLQFKAFTIAHPQFREALDTLHRSIQATQLRGEPSCSLLLGAPGTGKTRMCQQLTSEFGPRTIMRTDGGIQDIYPSIYCGIPNNVTIKGVVIALLQRFETYNLYQPMASLEHRLMNLLKNCQTKLIILDEWQHLLRRGAARTQETVCDWVKVLTDIFSGEVVLAGTPECELIIKNHQALAGRFPYLAHLHPFTLSSPEDYNDFVRLIRAFAQEIVKTMEFEEIPPLTDEKLILALYAITGGNMRSIRILLYETLSDALERNDKNLLVSDFEVAAERIILSTRLTNNNPFTMTLSQLRKTLYK
ncbi:hypothetical protein ABH905_005277 [Pseudomonas frederiksbergensis]|uniref:TniB family NTP-binding protein n=1 Tax=Pseudomonas frederiksbergensis TaxID=104087 RepID=UPI003D1B9612